MNRFSILGAFALALWVANVDVSGQQDRKTTKQPSGSTKPTPKPTGGTPPTTTPKTSGGTTPKETTPKSGSTPTVPDKSKEAGGKTGKDTKTTGSSTGKDTKTTGSTKGKDTKATGGATAKDSKATAKDPKILTGTGGKAPNVPPFGPKGKVLTQETHTKRMYSRAADAPLNSDERKAFDNLAGGRRLSQAERRVLRDLAASNRPGLAPDLREGISVMLNAEDPPANRNPVAQGQRYLRVKNDTPEALTVQVQYRSQRADGEWAWVPGDPESSQEAVAFTVEPGEVTFLTHADKFIRASRIRLWAESSMQEWAEYRDQDLRLVTETDPKLGQYVYYADTMQTYLFTFSEAGE